MSEWIEAHLLEKLKGVKNLLAFSHGVDSTALFYILNDAGVGFDIAIVDYNERAQSKDEVASARALAAKFDKKCFTKSVNLGRSNFECTARKARYEFFAEICAQNGYTNLILAHQLDDRFEWFLMQLAKGAGLNELLGMSDFERRKDYDILRPLLKFKKSQLEAFLKERGLKYFIDETNFSHKFRRNFMRQNFSKPFLERFSNGVIKSFELLQGDAQTLRPSFTSVADKIYLVKKDESAMRGVDKVCKILGVLMSETQRKECERCLGKGCVISGKVAVGANENFILVTPFVSASMDKNFKERCRVLRVPPINRGYLYSVNFDVGILRQNLI